MVGGCKSCNLFFPVMQEVKSYSSAHDEEGGQRKEYGNTVD